MYVCKVIGKVISTVKNEKLIGHSIVLVRTTTLAPDGTFVPGDQVFAAADTIGCGEGNYVLVTRGGNAGLPASARTLPLTWRWWAFWTEGSTASAEDPVSDQDMR